MALTAFGSFYFSNPIATSNVDDIPIIAAGDTTLRPSNEFDMPQNNRLRHTGTVTRWFNVQFVGSCSKSAGGTEQTVWYLYHQGILIPGASISRTMSSASDKGAFAIQAQLQLAQNEYVELWCESDGQDLQVDSGTLSALPIG
jgi:hypothetical protein